MCCFRIVRRKVSCNRGFTLIELIVVTCLLVVVGGGVYAAFSQGARLWHYALTSKPSIDLDLICDKMKFELHNSLLDSAHPLNGREDGFQFFTMTAGIADQNQTKIFGGHDRPVRINYYYDKSAGQILRMQEEYTDLLSTELHKTKTVGKVVLRNVRDCKFSYYAGQNQRGERIWKKSWEEPCMPQGVRLTMESDLIKQGQSWDQIISVRSGTCNMEKI